MAGSTFNSSLCSRDRLPESNRCNPILQVPTISSVIVFVSYSFALFVDAAFTVFVLLDAIASHITDPSHSVYVSKKGAKIKGPYIWPFLQKQDECTILFGSWRKVKIVQFSWNKLQSCYSSSLFF